LEDEAAIDHRHLLAPPPIQLTDKRAPKGQKTTPKHKKISKPLRKGQSPESKLKLKSRAKSKNSGPKNSENINAARLLLDELTPKQTSELQREFEDEDSK